jgi:hypothetical protein
VEQFGVVGGEFPVQVDRFLYHPQLLAVLTHPMQRGRQVAQGLGEKEGDAYAASPNVLARSAC